MIDPFSGGLSAKPPSLHNTTIILSGLKSSLALFALGKLLYIELALSFLIGREEYGEECASDVITADSLIIMSRTLKVTGNHVMYDRGA